MGRILGFFSDYVKPWKPPRSQSFCLPPNSLFENVGFFDGVYKDEVYGGGATIFLPENFSGPRIGNSNCLDLGLFELP